jgi:hypothetical protein
MRRTSMLAAFAVPAGTRFTDVVNGDGTMEPAWS